MELCQVVRLLLSPAFLLAAGLIYLLVKLTARWRLFQELTESVPGPPKYPYFRNLGNFFNIKSFQEVNHYIYRTFDKYGPIFKLWMAHELWICICDNDLAKEVSEFWSSYTSVPSFNFFGYAKEIGYLKKTACPFRVKIYETNPKPTVHLERVEQASRDFVEGLKVKAGQGALSPTDIRLAMQACMKRFLKDIDWQLDIREEYKNKIYFPFQDRIDLWVLRFFTGFFKILAKHIYSVMNLKNNPKISEDFLKISTLVFESQEKETPSSESTISTGELNLEVNEGPENHLSGEVCDHFSKQLSELVEKSALFLTNLLQDVAAHPQVLQKLQEEAKRVRGPDSPVVSLTHERKLFYTEMVLKEGLRLYSPPGFFLRTGKDFEYGKMVVPRGCICYISAEHIHKNFEFYENATSFNPEHFSHERMRTAPDGIFFPLPLEVPFCGDNRLVLKMMKMILSSLVGHFSLETNTPPDSIQHDFFLLNENLKTISLKSKPL